MENGTCPPDFIPADLPIPKNLNTMITPATNISDPAMTTCCKPNQVNVANNCWLWCEIPKSYFGNGATHDQVASAAGSCLRINSEDGTLAITGYRFSSNSGARTGAWTVKEVGVLVLALSGLMHIL